MQIESNLGNKFENERLLYYRGSGIMRGLTNKEEHIMNQQFRIDPAQIKLPKISFRLIISGLIGVVIIVGLFSCWFTISPEQVGVVLRFGKLNRTASPGLNFKIPFSIEQVYKVATERQEKVEFGFRTIKAGIRTVYSKKSFLKESLLQFQFYLK